MDYHGVMSGSCAARRFPFLPSPSSTIIHPDGCTATYNGIMECCLSNVSPTVR